jgi:hypothetical protein
MGYAKGKNPQKRNYSSSARNQIGFEQTELESSYTRPFDCQIYVHRELNTENWVRDVHLKSI